MPSHLEFTPTFGCLFSSPAWSIGIRLEVEQTFCDYKVIVRIKAVCQRFGEEKVEKLGVPERSLDADLLNGKN